MPRDAPGRGRPLPGSIPGGCMNRRSSVWELADLRQPPMYAHAQRTPADAGTGTIAQQRASRTACGKSYPSHGGAA